MPPQKTSRWHFFNRSQTVSVSKTDTVSYRKLHDGIFKSSSNLIVTNPIFEKRLVHLLETVETMIIELNRLS